MCNFERIYINIYAYMCSVYRFMNIGIVGRLFANRPEDRGSIPGPVMRKNRNTALYAPLLNTEDYKVRIRDKWSNPGENIPPSSISRWVGIEKGAFGSLGNSVGQDEIYMWGRFPACMYVHMYECVGGSKWWLDNWGLVWFGLTSLFNGKSSFVGYLIPKRNSSNTI